MGYEFPDGRHIRWRRFRSSHHGLAVGAVEESRKRADTARQKALATPPSVVVVLEQASNSVQFMISERIAQHKDTDRYCRPAVGVPANRKHLLPVCT